MARGALCFQTCRDVDTVSIDVVFFKNDIITMNANPPEHFSTFGTFQDIKISLINRILKIDGAIDRFNRTFKFRDDRVTGCVKNTSVVFFYKRINNLPACIQAFKSRIFVFQHMFAKANTVCGEDGREFPLYVTHHGLLTTSAPCYNILLKLIIILWLYGSLKEQNSGNAKKIIIESRYDGFKTCTGDCSVMRFLLEAEILSKTHV